ncbi:5-bromo-4-chloroindolyl phosphate hydrolysis protein [Lentibacillus halodurans]|uniref:5-bromo-4-chloroindolyl phosphate hydrolysis protein n=1 Tax=Lentibacillus halodurans TaxID=237679 RepID=A0A1I0VH72_9BACI|nr:5-bromo-4-chloroindolyl phosphate hydrolysis family protein [Lentibacillus halodurans]SFA74926.1 5-bromo-4-chloroindolyl phosphate hydrolysis protein [Lentibacillus halodurans]
MRRFFQFLLQSLIGTSAAVLTGLISFFAFGTAVLMSALYAVIAGGACYFLIKELMFFRYLQQKELSRKEYKYINENLLEAKAKIKRLQRTLYSVRNWQQAKKYIKILVTVRKIYANTKKEPRRFYQAEVFYYKHLDSLVALMEKYAYLKSQPSRSKEINQALDETRQTITALGEAINKDLYVMLHDDVDTLQFELDVANQSFKKAVKEESEALK